MSRRWVVAVPVLLVVLVGGVSFIWHEMTRVRPVSVSAVVARFRTAQAAANPSGTAGPTPGVYVYDTTGSEHVSAGGITHTYPTHTTATVVRTTCGMRVRWDALDQRWMQWDLCDAADGWHLHAFTDFHQFLAVDDRLDYVCAGDPRVLAATSDTTAGTTPLTATCTTATGRSVATIIVVGSEPVRVGGGAIPATHLHITSVGTGRSTASDSGDLWVGDDGLPLRATVTNHGEQHRLGMTISYDEHATFTLTTTTPLR